MSRGGISVAHEVWGPQSDGETLGAILRHERELRELSLEELCHITRIPMKMLRAIEADLYDELPGEVFTRGFLRAYAKAVGTEPDAIVARYERDRQPPEDVAPAPITAVTPPERGRRFGIAIAVVILLILFTLALSIVLRPRQHDRAIELSRGPSDAAALEHRPVDAVLLDGRAEFELG